MEPSIATLTRTVSRARSIPAKRLTKIVAANVRPDLDATERERVQRKLLNAILDGTIVVEAVPRRRTSRTTT